MLGIHNTSLQLRRVGMLTLDIHAALSYGFLEANMDFFLKKNHQAGNFLQNLLNCMAYVYPMTD